ncbi:hydroxyethylthiazole kinase [Pontibacter silvestris]|uniref:Hydroxyethylthiazole kinase n=1 Tax=Pontibacter silvestris TaxID=2305183 RepID=A0ABW4WYT7_9BACT|nr:hydroxyethylthiazole kinase [Pontibacter silvestris]MCC9135541.1 hydroxyethylthiazole kinase [Pontibacter silvestris]
MEQQLWNSVLAVREKSPLVHSITNYVVMNNTANALLAVGASPVMAHAYSEVHDMVAIAGALIINIGTLDEYWVESMKLAISQANTLGKPWLLDPVGAGATPYRNKVLQELLEYQPTVIRGNASEIMALASMSAGTKGVDSTNHTDEALDAAIQLNQAHGSVVCVSGATDLIVQEKGCLTLTNGDKLMTRVTGMGCTASALIGAFCATTTTHYFEATVAAMALMGIAGEIAAEKSPGPGSLQLHFLDTLYQINKDEFVQRVKLEEYNGGF